jgi:hypothetical protein
LGSRIIIIIIFRFSDSLISWVAESPQLCIRFLSKVAVLSECLSSSSDSVSQVAESESHQLIIFSLSGCKSSSSSSAHSLSLGCCEKLQRQRRRKERSNKLKGRRGRGKAVQKIMSLKSMIASMQSSGVAKINLHEPQTPRPGGVSQGSVLVVINATKDISPAPVYWAIGNVVRKGDALKILGIITHVTNPCKSCVHCTAAKCVLLFFSLQELLLLPSSRGSDEGITQFPHAIHLMYLRNQSISVIFLQEFSPSSSSSSRVVNFITQFHI